MVGQYLVTCNLSCQVAVTKNGKEVSTRKQLYKVKRLKEVTAEYQCFRMPINDMFSLFRSQQRPLLYMIEPSCSLRRSPSDSQLTSNHKGIMTICIRCTPQGCDFVSSANIGHNTDHHRSSASLCYHQFEIELYCRG